jgi:hypothetical protein
MNVLRCQPLSKSKILNTAGEVVLPAVGLHIDDTVALLDNAPVMPCAHQVDVLYLNIPK